MPETKDNLICATCNQRFATEETLIAHERSAHGINRPSASVERVNTSTEFEEKAS